VHCVAIQATGSGRTVTRNIDVTPGQSITTAVTGLPTGTVSIGALAYAAACSAVNASSIPSWASDPVSQVITVTKGIQVPLNLVLRPSGSVIPTIDWQDDGTGGAGGASGVGGATNAGGASGATNGTGGVTNGGGSGGVGCAVSPVSPNATQQAKNLLCYLYSIYGNHVLSGQQETSWSNPANDITWYSNNGMKLPAVLGGDYLYSDGGAAVTGTATRAIAYWNAGGIPLAMYTMGAPPNADTFANAQLSANLDNVVLAGTAENTSFLSKLDYLATQLQVLQTANVPVLLAPFHETQPVGWYWWSKGTGAQFVNLWKYTFNYLTATKGLKNIVWLMPFSGSPNTTVYPGKAFVDIAGADTYGTIPPFVSVFASAKAIVGTSVPIALYETGMIPNPDTMFPTAAPWVLFNVWAGYQSDGTHNTLASVQSAYASVYTITRDEVPNLK
jgi:hypothetical protein